MTRRRTLHGTCDRMEEAGAVRRDLGCRLSTVEGGEEPVRVRRMLTAPKEAVWLDAVHGTAMDDLPPAPSPTVVEA